MIKLAVVGDPIEHSMSPSVHGAVLEHLGIDYKYYKIQVKKGELESFIQYAISEGIDGFNLTMPHKCDIIPYLSGIDDEAMKYQSVNTVKVCGGKLYGYNTDAIGYTQALALNGEFVKNRRILILGAGGVSRTLAQRVAYEGAKSLTILNRTVSEAERVCSMVTKRNIELSYGELIYNEIYNQCRECDILINATPLGMEGIDKDFDNLDFIDVLPDGCVVTDLIYKPEETSFLKRAKARGLKTVKGYGMLILQGVLADEIYLSREIDKKEVYPVAEKAIKDFLLRHKK